MKKINELYDCKYNTLIKDIKINSKEVNPGDLFVCTKGISCDRHDFIDEAVSNGASFLIVKKTGNYKVPFIKVSNPNKELATLSRKFYDYPDTKLKLIGITGTDGKTTTATIIRDLLGKDLCGYIGTNGVMGKKINDKISNTTPECHIIYKYLYLFNKEDLKYVAMETSSESLLHGRLDSFLFDIGILTNITEDHLNVHKSMENYINSKKLLFKKIKDTGIAILNIDDEHYNDFSNITKNKITYGKNINADLCIKEITEKENNTEISFSYKNNIYNITSPLTGEFNVYNLMAAILCMLSLDFTIEDILPRIKNITIPKGRCEFLDFNTPYKIVLDYAHTPNGLLSILKYLNKIKKNRIITITGSAGGREKEKRNKMGKVVLDNSDLVIFTTDDPRYESPQEIINEMIKDNKGCYEVIIDREEAINFALDHARSGDIILIAGKGRDNYMAVEDKYIKYCDYDVVENYFNNISKSI